MSDFKPFFAAAVLAVLAFPVSAGPDRAADLKAVHDDVMKQIRQKQEAYERDQEKLKQTRKEAVDLAKKERRLLKRLDDADKSLAKTRAELALLEAQLTAVQADITATQEKLAWENVTLDQRRMFLSDRLKTLGLFGGPPDWLGSVLLYDDLSVPFQTWQGLASLAERDRTLIRESRARRDGLAEAKAALEESHKKLTRIQDQKKTLSLRQETERRRRQSLFEEVQGRRSALEELARQMEEDAANMNILMATLRERAAKLQEEMGHLRKAFEEKKGFLRWPVSSESVEKVLSYGRVYDENIREWRVNKGIDIWTKSNQSIVAVSKGEIVFSDFFSRMGNMVLISHGGDYYTLYAHLSEIGVRLGDRVEDGAPIGRAGHTGRLGEDAVLHFEIRQGGAAVDPTGWLRRRN